MDDMRAAGKCTYTYWTDTVGYETACQYSQLKRDAIGFYNLKQLNNPDQASFGVQLNTLPCDVCSPWNIPLITASTAVELWSVHTYMNIYRMYWLMPPAGL